LFKEVLNLDPDNSGALNNLGLIHEFNKEFPEALEVYRKSLLINPFHEETNFNLASLQYALFRVWPESAGLDEIISRLNFIISLNPFHHKAEKLLDRIQQEKQKQLLS